MSQAIFQDKFRRSALRWRVADWRKVEKDTSRPERGAPVNFIVAARKYVRQDAACGVAIATDKRKRERATEDFTLWKVRTLW